MDKVYLKTYVKGKQTLVAVCDMSLIGRTLREGRIKLEVTSKFYEGEAVTAKDAAIALSKADAGNLVGDDAVRLAVENNLVDPEAIIYIEGVPHVQLMRL